MSRNRWKKAAGILCLCALLAGLTGCAKKEPLSLTVWTYYNGEQLGAFNEAVEALEEGYAGTALRTTELEQYYRMAEDFLDRCGAKKPLASAAPEEQKAAPRSARPRSEGQRKASGSGSRSRSRSPSNGRRNTGGAGRKDVNSRRKGSGKRTKKPRTNYAVLGLLAVLLAVGLLLRWFGMKG